MAVTFQVALELIECCNCAIYFAVPSDWNVARRRDHARFYCPNGHGQSYMQESDVAKAQRLQREAEQRLQAQVNEANHARLVAERARDKAVHEKRKVERRIAHGVCPCCNKTFADIANHMVTEHKDFRLPQGKEQKRLTA